MTIWGFCFYTFYREKLIFSRQLIIILITLNASIYIYICTCNYTCIMICLYHIIFYFVYLCHFPRKIWIIIHHVIVSHRKMQSLNPNWKTSVNQSDKVHINPCYCKYSLARLHPQKCTDDCRYKTFLMKRILVRSDHHTLINFSFACI